MVVTEGRIALPCIQDRTHCLVRGVRIQVMTLAPVGNSFDGTVVGCQYLEQEMQQAQD